MRGLLLKRLKWRDERWNGSSSSRSSGHHWEWLCQEAVAVTGSGIVLLGIWFIHGLFPLEFSLYSLGNYPIGVGVTHLQ